MHEVELLHQALTRLVLEDPREARALFVRKVASDFATIDSLLNNLTSADGRLRHLVANVARSHQEKERFVPHLLKWRKQETDEFTRRAIDAALGDVDERAYSISQSTRTPPIQLVEVYGYVADRLKHRIRNSLFGAHANLDRLRTLLNGSSAGEIGVVVAKLHDAMIDVGRTVEAIEVDPDYFQQRSISLLDWIKQMNVRYASVYSPVGLRITGDDAHVVVLASDYLLETIFWNLWINAHQAIPVDCEVRLDIRRLQSKVEIAVLDNGDGFPEEMRDVAFDVRHSTKNSTRGRGLMEIQDAVARLEGAVALYDHGPSGRRVRLTLPLHRIS